MELVEKVLEGYPLLHQLSQRRSHQYLEVAYTDPWECRVKLKEQGEEFDAICEWNAGDLHIKAKDGSKAYVLKKPQCYSLLFSFDEDATESVTLVGNNKVWSS